MITSIRLVEFRCFRDLTLNLRPLTVIVGPNAVGKSSILDALMLSQGFEYGDRRQGAEADTTVSVDQADGPGWTVNTEQDDLLDPPDSTAGNGGTRIRIAPDLEAMRAPVASRQASQLSSDGVSLANVLLTMARRRQLAYSDEFARLVPSFQAAEVGPTTENGLVELRFQDRWNEDAWLTPHQVSDGTLLTAAYLALAYQPDQPDIVVIDEPETGLHPRLIGQVMRVIQEVVDKGVQVVLATHSPLVLDHVPPESVIFLRREADTGDIVAQGAPTEADTWGDYLRAYDDSLGDAWLSGGLGG